MYHVTVPIMNSSVTKDTREIYLKQFRDAQIDRILLSTFGYGTDPATDQITAEALRENIQYFRSKGIETGVWIGYTIGHGSDLAVGADYVPDRSKFTKMMSLSGQVKEFVCCPLDITFRERMAKYVSAIAASGTKTVLLDDDFRMWHGEGFHCGCDLHMKRIRELCGEDISREELEELAFTGKPNRYREAWFTAQREGLELLAADIRKAVDAVAPNVRVGYCTVRDHFGIDGIDPLKLAKILAGENTEPLIRLSGAPYWARKGKMPLHGTIETARMLAHYCKNRGAEIISEGDTYPRPRYTVPASYLEIFDAALRIDGQYDGVLKYMVDYNGSAEFEPSYLSHHARNIPLMHQLEEIFAGKDQLGVNVSLHQDLYDDLRREADLALCADALGRPYPKEGTMLALNSIPGVYGDGGMCRVIFGESARHVPLSEISKGAVLDSVAAQILSERGVDTGLLGQVQFRDENSLYLTDPKGEKAYVTPSQLRFGQMQLASGAETVCSVALTQGTEPFAYRYENAAGGKFLVFAFVATALPENTGMFRGYMQQKLLKDGIEWIAGEKLPAFVEKCPDLYIMCKGKGGKMAVALFNIFADSIDDCVVTLDKVYSGIRFVNCAGKLDGNRVILEFPIHAYTFAAFEVFW